MLTQGLSGYHLREMIVYKGASGHRAGKMFERLIRNSHVKDAVPLRVTARLEDGPRKATKGFSHH